MRIFNFFKNNQMLSHENDEINNLNSCKQNALHTAIVNNDLELIKSLIEKGININAQDFKGATPLHFAAAYNNLLAAQILVDAGAKVNLRDVYGNNALWTAVFNGQKIKYYDLVVFLMNNNADSYNINNAKKSPIDFAKQVGYIELIEILERKY